MRIAIDYDGTIADTNRGKVRWIREHLSLDIAPWDCNRTNCVPIIGADEYGRMSDVVYERDSTLAARPVPGAIAALETLSASHELHVVSARLERRLAFAREWLRAHQAARYFLSVCSAYDGGKPAICLRIGADALIDDDARHLRPSSLSPVSGAFSSTAAGPTPRRLRAGSTSAATGHEPCACSAPSDQRPRAERSDYGTRRVL
jgi:phosphoglycolate phosphatase-like HAD superfamily hydrolase